MRKEFHDVVSLEEAQKRFMQACLEPRVMMVPLERAAGRVLARNIIAGADVPPFDRSARDGYAVVASDTYKADEESPVVLNMIEQIPAGRVPEQEVSPGRCSEIATGAMIPRGANAVVMVEHTDTSGANVRAYRPVAPGEHIMHAGSDMMQGELLLHEGSILTPRETAVIAAQGIGRVSVYAKPTVAVISTGDEVLEPGASLLPGMIYDSNARIICDLCNENGAEARFIGVVKDDSEDILAALRKGLAHDMVIMSGGTSAGTGDICYRALEQLGEVLVHGVAVKPGKPVVLGKAWGKPVAILPGFPTSAAVTLMLFVMPVLRHMAGLGVSEQSNVRATLPVRLNSDKGKHELALVHLIRNRDGYSAYPVGKGSGSICGFAFADGFLEIPAGREAIFAGTAVNVRLLSRQLRPADICFIGSHCVMIEPAVHMLRKAGFYAKVAHVGSSAGLDAARRGESDITGTHLLDNSGVYNIPFISCKGLVLVRGYQREQGILFRKENGRKDLKGFVRSGLRMINRNQGSGTRVLFDMLLSAVGKPNAVGLRIPGYEVEASTHTSVAAAIALHRADWGIAIRTVAERYGLEFIPLRFEDYDFCIPRAKVTRPAVREFLKILKSQEFRTKLEVRGIRIPEDMGDVIWPK